MRALKTTKGTELPLTDLKGKEYLEVKYRLLWFREEKPEWRIETELLERTNEMAAFKAVIRDETGAVRATGHGIETVKGFHDFFEKAETIALGRALAHAGYGTQFAVELEEGEKLADPPINPVQAKSNGNGHATQSNHAGEFQIGFGKFRGKRLKEIGRDEIFGYINWVQQQAHKTNKPLSASANELIMAAETFWAE